jgi:hypothetical protein
MPHNATLKQRLFAGFAVLILSTLIGAVYSIVVIRGLTATVSKAAGIKELGKVATASSDMVGLERVIVLHSIFDDKAQVEKHKTQFQSTDQSLRQLMERVAGRLGSGSGKAMVELLGRKQGEWMAMHNEVMNLLASQQVDVAEKKVADPSFVAAADEIRRLANQLSEVQSKFLTDEAAAEGTSSLISSVTLVVL